MLDFIVKKINRAIDVAFVYAVWQIANQQPVFAFTFFQRFFRTFYFGNIHGDKQQAADVSVRIAQRVDCHPDRKWLAIFAHIRPFTGRQLFLGCICKKNIASVHLATVFEA